MPADSNPPPQSPEGYGEASPYPESRWIRAKWLVVMFIVSVVIFLPTIRDMFIRDPVSIVRLVASNPAELVATTILVAAFNVIPHEYMHKLTSSRLGYPSKIKWRQIFRGIEPFNYIENEWIESKDYQVILLAPLVVITIVAGVLVWTQSLPLIRYVGTAFLVINTSTSGDDVRKFILLMREPRQMKIRHQIENRGLIVYRAYAEETLSVNH